LVKFLLLLFYDPLWIDRDVVTYFIYVKIRPQFSLWRLLVVSSRQDKNRPHAQDLNLKRYGYIIWKSIAPSRNRYDNINSVDDWFLQRKTSVPWAILYTE